MATMVLYMTDVQEVVVEEVPEYTLENYMSDVGGASGLILGRAPRTRWLSDGRGQQRTVKHEGESRKGMSMATMIGFIEYVLVNISKVISQWVVLMSHIYESLPMSHFILGFMVFQDM